MKFLAVLPLVGLFLAGCVTDNTATVASPPQIQVVKVPVVKPWPQPPVIAKPDLAINHIDNKSTQTEKVRALETSVDQLVTYSNKQHSALEVYRNNKLNLKRKHNNKVS